MQTYEIMRVLKSAHISEDQSITLDYQGSAKQPRLIWRDPMTIGCEDIPVIREGLSGDVLTIELPTGHVFQLVENPDQFYLLCDEALITTLPVLTPWTIDLDPPEPETAPEIDTSLKGD